MQPPDLKLPPQTGLLWFDSLDSTNVEAKRQAAQGIAGPLWIVAERQTAGRGRRGRAWLSETGNLTATYLVRPKLSPAEAARLSFAAALAVADLIDGLWRGAAPHSNPPPFRGRESSPAVSPPSERGRVREGVLSREGLAEVKWPNDVIIRGRKIAGILLESAAGPPNGPVSWLAIGIGVNLRHHPEGMEFPATSLTAEGIAAPALGEAVERLAGALAHWLDEARAGFAPIRAAWLARGPAIGTALRLRLGEEIVMGRFGGLSEEGALILREESGATRLVTAGDVFFS